MGEFSPRLFYKQDGILNQTCLVEFPNAGHWCIGLISARRQGEIPGTRCDI